MLADGRMAGAIRVERERDLNLDCASAGTPAALSDSDTRDDSDTR
ncbi:MAG: hypothetical protein AAF989_09440 [Planctomycetota bacterium]